MLGIVGSILSNGLGIFNTWLGGKQKLAEAEIHNKQRLLMSEASHNSEWEMASLQDKDKWLRRVSFGLFSFPIVMAWFDPDLVYNYFNIAINAIPQWYVDVYIAMVGGIWGISELKRMFAKK